MLVNVLDSIDLTKQQLLVTVNFLCVLWHMAIKCWVNIMMLTLISLEHVRASCHPIHLIIPIPQ